MTVSTKSVLAIAIFISACLAIFTSYDSGSVYFWVLKPLTTILIIALPLFFADQVPNVRQFDRKIIIAGLIFCLGGDAFLLKEDFFVYGLSSFFIAHLLFSWVFLRLADSQLRLLPLLALFIFSATYFWFLYPNLGPLVIPVACYLCCIIFMCWQSYRVHLTHRNHWSLTLAVAATLFVLSDSMIAFNKFLLPFDASNALILGTYWLSVFMIAWLFTENFYMRTSAGDDTTKLDNTAVDA